MNDGGGDGLAMGGRPSYASKKLGGALGIVQPVLSRWERYWQDGDWPGLLSQQAQEVLTLELRQRIIGIWARVPMWGIVRVQRFLMEQG